MLKIYTSIVDPYVTKGKGSFRLCAQTIEYTYPASLVKVTYKLQGEFEKEKTFYLEVFFGDKTRLYKSKNPLSKVAQEVLSSLIWGGIKPATKEEYLSFRKECHEFYKNNQCKQKYK